VNGSACRITTAALVVLAALAACGKTESTKPAAAAPPVSPAPVAPALPFLAAPADPDAPKKVNQFRGFSMQLCEPKGAEDCIKAVDELSAMGCTSINFVISARQKDIHAETIAIHWEDMPTAPEIEKILKHAKEKKMLVMLMPIVLLDDAHGKDWRGVIEPEDWDNWFVSYTNYMTTMAKLANRCDVDVLLVGSELLSTETFRERWTKVIKTVRDTCDKGRGGKNPIKLSYSANWDHYTVPTFWDQLDYIAMNNYNELAKNPGVPVDELIKKWDPIKAGILKFAKEQKKPFFFSEVGWHNKQNTIREPWNYVAEGPIDLGEQEHAFKSFVEAWKDVSTDQFMGAFIWEWRPNIDGSTHPGTYSLQKTPALEVVKEWMKGAEWK
jgi:hypothetical protein